MAAPLQIAKRLSLISDAVCGNVKSLEPDSPLKQLHYDTLVDLLLAVYDECSSGQLAAKSDKYVGSFLAKYAACVKDLKLHRVSAADFEVKGVIGRGHFGEVQVVRERSSGAVYAMKVMKKQEILKQADSAFFQEERDIMAWTSSPWLTWLAHSFVDGSSLYLVMQYHPGGDLLSVLERGGDALSEEGVRFYMAEVAAALRDLHQLGFVHRDVKPDNVLITVSGHIKLVDFGSAARLQPGGLVDNPALPVGTPEYIAPEVLTSLNAAAAPAGSRNNKSPGGSYGVCCDWWSLGIIGYELQTGVTPFEGGTTAGTYANIMGFRQHLAFPEEGAFSPALRDLLEGLLSSQDSRLQFGGIREHAFFAGLPWDNLFAMPPPFIPKVSGVDDMSNFEPPSPAKKTLPGLDHAHRELPFVGYSFSKSPSNQRMSPGNHLSSSKSGGQPEAGEGSGAELSAMISEVRSILQSREETLSQVEQSQRFLQQDRLSQQSQLEELQRTLDMERSERHSAEAKPLQLLSEVREYHQKIISLKEARAKESVAQYQKALVLAEEEKREWGGKVARLQEALDHQVRETESSEDRAARLSQKLTQVKESQKTEVTALQNKLVESLSASEARTRALSQRLREAQEESQHRARLILQLQEGGASQVDGASQGEGPQSALLDKEKLRAEVEDLKVCLGQTEREIADLTTALSESSAEVGSMKEALTASGLLSIVLEGKMKALEAGAQQKVREQEETQQKLSALLVSLEARDQRVKELGEECRRVDQLKDRNAQDHLQALAVLEDRRSSLEVKLEHFEQMKTRAEQNHAEAEKVSALSGENLRLKEKLAQSQRQIQTDAGLLRAGERDLADLRQQLAEQGAEQEREGRDWEERLARQSQALQAAEARTLEERVDKELLGKKVDKLTAEVTDLRGRLSSACSLSQLELDRAASNTKVSEMTALVKTLERRVSVLQETRAAVSAELSAAADKASQLEQELEAQRVTVSMKGDQLRAAEEQVGELQSSLEQRGRERERWARDRLALEADLQAAEARLEKTAASLDTERTLRVDLEAQNVRCLELFQRSSAVHSEEIQRHQQSLHSQRRLGEGYSRRIAELEGTSSSLQTDRQELGRRAAAAEAQLTAAQSECKETRLELNRVKASLLKLSQESASQTAHMESLAQVDKAREEQLRSLLASKEQQEVRMRTTIQQQTKLISHAISSRTPPPRESKLKKGLRKLMPRSRNPEREVEEWKELTGMLQKSASVGSAVSLLSVTSERLPARPTLPASRSPGSRRDFPLSRGSPGGGSVRSEDSSSALSPPRKRTSASLLPTPPSLLAVDPQPPHSTSFSAGSKRPTLAAATTGGSAGKNPVPGRTEGPSSSLLQQHNIPHKFLALTTLPALRGRGQCVVCGSTLNWKKKVQRCVHCKVACHQDCMGRMPNSCGLPPGMARAVAGGNAEEGKDPATEGKDPAAEGKGSGRVPRSEPGGVAVSSRPAVLVASGNSSTGSAPSNSSSPLAESISLARSVPPSKKPRYHSSPPSGFPLITGQLSVYRPDGRLRSPTAMWAVLEDRQLRLYSTELAHQRGRPPLLQVPLADPNRPLSVAHPLPALPPPVKGPLDCVFALKSPPASKRPPCGELFFTVPQRSRLRPWTDALRGAIPAPAGLVEVSLELQPMDLSRHSSVTNMSIYSEMFDEV